MEPPPAVPDWTEVAANFDLRAFLDASDDAVIGKTLDNVIRSWNRTAERMYGYTADEVIGKSLAILVPGMVRLSDDRVTSIHVSFSYARVLRVCSGSGE